MSKIMKEKRVVKKCKPHDVEPVQEFLLDPTWPVPVALILHQDDKTTPDSGDDTPTQIFRTQMEKRRADFSLQRGFSKKQKEYLDRCLTYLGDYCASRQRHGPLHVAWLKWRATGHIPRENSVSTYMYGLGLAPDDTDHGGVNCLWDVVAVHGLLFPPNEKTVTLRIQSLIGQNNPLAAEELLGSLSEFARLRTFAPILSHYCNSGRMADALRLFHQMRNSPGVYLDAATYAMLVSSLSRRGYFGTDHHSPNNLAVERYSVTGPELFDELAMDMAEDLLELSEDAANTIYSGLMQKSSGQGPVNKTAISALSDPLEPEKLAVGRVSVDELTGECAASGAKLRLLALNEAQRQHVRATLLDMAFSLQEEFRAAHKPKGNSSFAMEPPSGDFCRRELQNFSKWLVERVVGGEKPFTTFVDGANIAHFGSGYVQYSQVKLMVKELERMGENPLVIMPRKYANDKFFLRHVGVTQELNPRDQQTIQELVSGGKIFIVPAACFDDYYWMIASVTTQQAGSEMDSPKNQPLQKDEKPLTGLRPVLITNDQMRDHRLALLEPRPFRRWTSCHIVNYAIAAYENDPWEDRKVTLFPPTTFSREIQSNVVPGDEHGRLAWHFPVTEWSDPERLCISFPPSSNSV